MADESNSISRLADALLVAEAVYQRAREIHDRERSALSQRVLDEARNRLEYLESRAFDLPSEPEVHDTDYCPDCGGEPTVERWSALGEGRAVHNGRTIRIARLLPEWAVDFALRGTAVVSRLSCRECGTEIAVVSGEPD